MKQKRWAPYFPTWEAVIQVMDADVVVVAGCQYILKSTYTKLF